MTLEQYNFSLMVSEFKSNIYGYPNLDFFIAGIIIGMILMFIMYSLYVKWIKKEKEDVHKTR